MAVFFVTDKERQLRHLPQGKVAGCIVFGYLVGQEIHAIPFGESLFQPGVEFVGRSATDAPRWMWKATIDRNSR